MGILDVITVVMVFGVALSCRWFISELIEINNRLKKSCKKIEEALNRKSND